MKKTLNEEISRIKGMMGMINENDFEGSGVVMPDASEGQPEEINVDPAIKDEAMKLAEMIKNEDENIVIHDAFDQTIVLGVDDPNVISLEYDYDVDVHEYPYFKSGRNWMSNGDPGYPDEGSDGEGDVYVTNLKIVDGEGNVIYDGKDFTNMELPPKYSNDILDSYFDANKDSGY